MLYVILISLLVGAVGGFFLLKEEALDKLKVSTIVLLMFALAVFVILEYVLVSHFCDVSGTAIPDALEYALIAFGAILVGIAMYLAYYLCCRLRSFKKIFGIACIGLVGGIGLLYGGSCLEEFLWKQSRDPYMKARDTGIVKTLSHFNLTSADYEVFSKEELMKAGSESPDRFDQNYLFDIGASADFVCQLVTRPSLGSDLLETVMDTVKDQLKKDGFRLLGWKDDTEIYVKGRGDHYRKIFQIIGYDSPTPVFRYSGGTFGKDTPSLRVTRRK